MSTLREEITAVFSAHGVAAHGVTGADPFPGVTGDLRAAVESGRSAGLPFTFSDPETAGDIRRSFPWARCLVVAAMPYLPAAGSPGPSRPGTGRIARFATTDHYRPLRVALEAVAEVVSSAGHQAEVILDDHRLVDRAAAVRAGVAWWGKSTMALVPGSGPWVLLGSIITDADLPNDEPMRRNCGTCVACIPACPTGAIVSPGVLDARRCLAAVLQSPGWIPRELRPLVGDRFYGCDDCLDACPPGDRLLQISNTKAGRVDMYEVLGWDDATLRASFPHFYVPRNQGRWLRRNALVVLGNTGGAAAVGVLSGYAAHPDPMLRGHAAWALGRIGDPRGRAVLTRIARDADAEVAREATMALGG